MRQNDHFGDVSFILEYFWGLFLCEIFLTQILFCVGADVRFFEYPSMDQSNSFHSATPEKSLAVVPCCWKLPARPSDVFHAERRAALLTRLLFGRVVLSVPFC